MRNGSIDADGWRRSVAPPASPSPCGRYCHGTAGEGTAHYRTRVPGVILVDMMSNKLSVGPWAHYKPLLFVPLTDLFIMAQRPSTPPDVLDPSIAANARDMPMELRQVVLRDHSGPAPPGLSSGYRTCIVTGMMITLHKRDAVQWNISHAPDGPFCTVMEASHGVAHGADPPGPDIFANLFGCSGDANGNMGHMDPFAYTRQVAEEIAQRRGYLGLAAMAPMIEQEWWLALESRFLKWKSGWASEGSPMLVHTGRDPQGSWKGSRTC